MKPQFITFKGRTLTRKQWSEITGLSVALIAYRTAAGKSPAEILAPITRITITHDGLTLTIKEWSRRTGLSKEVIEYRMKADYSVAEVFAPVGSRYRSRFIGHTFGHLYVSKYRRGRYECVCLYRGCGRVKILRGKQLTQGQVISCGCYRDAARHRVRTIKFFQEM
jgi:hypothetical protein